MAEVVNLNRARKAKARAAAQATAAANRVVFGRTGAEKRAARPRRSARPGRSTARSWTIEPLPPLPAMTEAEFLAGLRALPLHPGARDLRDDAATLGDLVLTTDTLVEGVHFLGTDPAEDVAWKLLAVNLSDLAAKGAVPEGCCSTCRWAGMAGPAFLAGLAGAMATFDTRLIGGDTVSLPEGAPRVLTCTAIGRSGRAPARNGARRATACG